jgi:hypothetical protein
MYQCWAFKPLCQARTVSPHVLVKTIHESGYYIPTPWYEAFEVSNVSYVDSRNDIDADDENADDELPVWGKATTVRVVSNTVSTRPSNRREMASIGWLTIMTIVRELMDDKEFSVFCCCTLQQKFKGVHDKSWTLLCGFRHKNALKTINDYNEGTYNTTKIPASYSRELIDPKSDPVLYSVLRKRLKCALDHMSLRLANEPAHGDARLSRYSNSLTATDCIAWMATPFSSMNAKSIFGVSLDSFLTAAQDTNSVDSIAGQEQRPTTPTKAVNPTTVVSPGHDDAIDRDLVRFPCTCPSNPTTGKEITDPIITFQNTQNYFGAKYMDGSGVNIADDVMPSVSKQEFPDTNMTNIPNRPTVYNITNPLSSETVNWMWQVLGNLEYVHGCAGRDGTRVRCFLDEEVDPHPEHSDKRVFMRVANVQYRCFQATPEEKKILGWFQRLSLLMFGDVGVPNGLYINIHDSTRGQGSHHDWHLIHGSDIPDDSYRTGSGSTLPTQNQATTLTLSLMQHMQIPLVPCVTWKNDDGDTQARVVIDHVCQLHAQGKITQSLGFKHVVDNVPNPDLQAMADTADENETYGRCIRATVSARIFANPRICLRCWCRRALPGYGNIHTGEFTAHISGLNESEITRHPFESEKEVVVGVNSKHVKPGNDHDAKVTPEFKRKYDLTHVENSDLLRSCKRQRLLEMDIPTSSTFLSERGCVADRYLTAPYIKSFLSHGIVPHVKGYDGLEIASLAHIFHGHNAQREYFVRGYWYQESTVRDALDMQKGRQNKKERKYQIPDTKDYRHVIGCMNGRAYKNILEGMNMYFTDPDYRTIEFIGSGGSSEIGGSNGIDPKAAYNTNKIVGVLPHNQTLNNINTVLLECAINDRVVALFVHSSVCEAVQSMYGTICGEIDFTKPESHPDMKTQYLCLGYVSLESSYIAPGEPISDIRSKYQRMPKHMAGPYLRFLESKKFVIQGTLLDDKLLQGLPVRNCAIGVGDIVCSRKWSLYSIMQEPKERVLMPIPKGKINQALGISEESVSVDAFREFHIKSIIDNQDDVYGIRDLSPILEGSHPIPLPKKFETQNTYDKLRLKRMCERLGRETVARWLTELYSGIVLGNCGVTGPHAVVNESFIDRQNSSNNEDGSTATRYDKDPVVQDNDEDDEDDDYYLFSDCMFSPVDDNDGDGDSLSSDDDDSDEEEFQEDDGNDEAMTKQTDEEEDETVTKKTKDITIRSFVKGLVFGCAAVVLRALGESLLEIPRKGKKSPERETTPNIEKDLCYADCKNKVTQAQPLSHQNVGSKNQLYANPCPTKLLDLGCSTMRLEILRRYKFREDNCPLQSNGTVDPIDFATGVYSKDFSDDAFRALVLTMLGRPGVLGNYAKNKCQGYADSYIPGPESIHILLSHMRENSKGGSRSARFLNTQWKQPQSINKFTKVAKFLDDYAKIHQQFFRTQVLEYTPPEGSSKSRRRVFKDRWVQLLTENCLSVTGDDTTKWHFQLGQAISTLEASYGKFLGEREGDSIVLGSGSIHGWDLLQRGGVFPGTKRFSKKNHKGVIHLSDVMTNQQAKMIIDEMKELSDKELACLLMEVRIENGEKVLRNIVNGLIVDLVDVEHWLCKLHLYLKVHTPGYEARENPKNAQPCCQPFITHDRRLCILEDKCLHVSTLKAREQFLVYAGSGKTYRNIKEMPPDVFLVPEEIDRYMVAFESRQHTGDDAWITDLFLSRKK